MMYEEFCDGVGMKIDRKCYERIEAVYMAFDRFTSKESIYDFHKKHDMNGVETLYSALRGFTKLFEQQAHLQAEVARDEEISDMIIKADGAFWREHIQKEIPPELDDSASWRKYVERKFPKDNGDVRLTS